MSTYRIHIDESGEREYGDATSAYFVYCGVVVLLSDLATANAEVARHKKAYFGTEEVEYKSNWFRIPKERRLHYLNPFGLTDTVFSEMTRELYRIVGELPIVLLAAVIDKRGMVEKYSAEKAYSPSAFAYELLMERFQFYLKDVGGQDDVWIDDISGRKPGGHAYKVLISNLQRKLQIQGSTAYKIRIDRIHGQPKFVPSECCHMVQVADLCAYNVMRQFRTFGRLPTSATDIYGGYARAADKFRIGPNGAVDGYGIVCFPKR